MSSISRADHRAGKVNHSGRLSLPGGFVPEGKTLVEALASELSEEILIGFPNEDNVAEEAARQQVSFTFGPHDKAPSATFVGGFQTHLLDGQTVVHANEEWAKEILVVVPIDVVKQALNGDLSAIKKLFAEHDLDAAAGFAPDVAGPLAEFLDV